MTGMTTPLREAAANVSRALYGSPLGACWKCMTLSAGLLAASAGVLAAVVAWLPPVAAFLASLATGFFAVFTGAHVLMFILRRRAAAHHRAPRDRNAARGCCN